MCGLTGYLGGGVDRRVLKSMADKIYNRGPDEYGEWIDEQNEIAIGHRRLSILELTSAGAQPMRSVCGRYIIAFNGEIYNHLELRGLLKAKNITWRGSSDTETLLMCFTHWGVDKTIELSVGMFAIAIWDRLKHGLTLIRDRMGEKPLYYGWQNNGGRASFLFASDLLCFKAHPAFLGEVDRHAMSYMLKNNAVRAPHSIYQGINKLEPGHMLTISLEKRSPCITSYWSITEIAKKGVLNKFAGSDIEGVAVFEKLITKAVNQQMVSDVPLGAFLSGGIDSSLIVALMQLNSKVPIKTFTIGFEEKKYDEAVYAEKIAKHLGTEQTTLYVSDKDVRDVIPLLPSIYSEPFSDSSQIPTYLVSKLARQEVKVALSGDGGDELFCGYSRYNFVEKFWRRINYLPLPLRRLASLSVEAIPIKLLNVLLSPLTLNNLRVYENINYGDKLKKAGKLFESENIDELYKKFMMQWGGQELVIGVSEIADNTFLEKFEASNILSNVEKMMLNDGLNYLPNDILVKTDRAAMAVSLEGRVPLLDHNLVEFAWSLPHQMKSRDGVSKWIMRQLLYKHIPRDYIDRPKKGFSVPIEYWLRGPLRDWMEDLLSEHRLKTDGYFQVDIIRKKMSEHLSGQRNWHNDIWSVLMMQEWLRSR